MEHPGLHVRILLFFDESFVEEAGTAVENVAGNFDFSIASERKAPNDVGGHPTIAFTLFPPTPTAVGMLKIGETVETGLHDFIQFLQIFFAVRMSSSSRGGFDAAEDGAHDVLWLEAVGGESFRCDRGR